MYGVHRELGIVAVASQAALAQRRGVGQSVRCGCLVVVAALTSGCDGPGHRCEAPRAGHHRLCPDLVHLIRIIHVAGAAITEIAREADVLIVRSSQDVGIRKRVATMNTVDLRGHADALLGSAIGKGRIVADYTLLGPRTAAAVDESQILVASAALRRRDNQASRDHRAAVHREVILNGSSAVGSGSLQHCARH